MMHFLCGSTSTPHVCENSTCALDRMGGHKHPHPHWIQPGVSVSLRQWRCRNFASFCLCPGWWLFCSVRLNCNRLTDCVNGETALACYLLLQLMICSWSIVAYCRCFNQHEQMETVAGFSSATDILFFQQRYW